MQLSLSYAAVSWQVELPCSEATGGVVMKQGRS